MGYLHVDIAVKQSAKRPHPMCGDVVEVRRGPLETWVVLADGIGSGPLANLAASMCASRLMALLEGGLSLREAFGNLVQTMKAWREPGQPYAAFNVARIRAGGAARILSYEAPPPLLLDRREATVMPQRRFEYAGAYLGEADVTLAPGDGLLLMSDGITQAGLGRGFPEGWGADGACWFATEHVRLDRPLPSLAEAVHDEARRCWGSGAGDDCTTVMLHCREGRAVTVMSGPPSSKKRDAAVVRHFLGQEGLKVVCGGTTAKLVARETGAGVTIDETSMEALAPPSYRIDGIDLVTEGAVTLTQAYNLMDADPNAFEPNSGASSLCRALREADRVSFIIGRADNPATGDIAYRQQGILPREKVVRLLARTLDRQGKTVSVDYV